MFLSQPKYIFDLLLCTKMTGVKHISTLMVSGLILFTYHSELLYNPRLNQSVVRALQYIKLI